MSTIIVKPLVYIEGGGNKQYWDLVESFGTVTFDHDEADIVLFTGGKDISPSIYGDGKELLNVNTDPVRDADEIIRFTSTCMVRDLVSIGICRGGQFLAAMNGSKLWQDVTNHRNSHPVMDVKSGKQYRVASTHHQMMQWPQNKENICELLAVATKFDLPTKKITPTTETITDTPDIEALWFPQTMCLCVQWHPEYPDFPEGKDLFMEYINRLVLPTVWKNKVDSKKNEKRT